MKKNYLFGLISLFTVLFMASCQEEDVYGGASDANTGMVTFKVNTQQVGTRAATGEGALADSLYYGVYEYVNEEWSLVEAISKTTPNSAQPISLEGTVVNIRLAKQKQYSVIFWAQSDSTMFTVDWANHKISVKSPIYANAEGYDAFWACDTVTINGALSKDIQLVRPFAQLNIGISNDDLQAAKDASVEVVSSAVTVKGVPTSMDLMGGTVANVTVDDPEAVVSYSLNAIPANDAWTFPVSGYQYLALNYVLVGREKSLATVELAYKDSEGLDYTNKFTDVPVRRNYRTNVYGDLLTNEAEYEIDINAAWSGTEANIEIVEVATAADIQEAINNMQEGDSLTIVLTDDIDLNDLFNSANNAPARTRATATQPVTLLAGRSLTIDLNGFSISGTDNGTESYGLITNKGDLTINGTGTIQLEATQDRGWSAYSSVISNTVGGKLTVNGGTIQHLGGTSMAYAIDNLTNGKGTYAETIINGGEIKSTYRPIRMFLNGVEADNILTVNAGTIESTGGNKAAIWMQDPSANANTGTLYVGADAVINNGVYLDVTEGSTEWPVTVSIAADALKHADHKVITENLPVGYSVNEIDGVWTVVITYVAKIGEVGYTTLQKAVDAVEDGRTITLVANETFTENNRYDNGGWWDGLGYNGDKSFTIDLGGYSISQDGALNDYLMWFKNDGAKENTITFKNGTINAGTTAYCALATASSNAQKITINTENITFINNNSNGATLKIRGGSELNVNAGTIIEGKDSYVGIEAVGNNTVVNIFDGVEIYQKGTSSYVGAIVGASYNATMNIYGGYGKSAKCGIIVMSTGATINVSGGEWIANNDGTVAGGNQGVLVSQNNRNESGWACKSVMNVTGGTFKGGYDCWGMGPGVEPDDAQINIKGGNFNADPTNYVVAGYEVTGNYTVGEPEALAELKAAIANGGNVTLSEDVTLLESLVIEKGQVVLDLNGKTITAPLFSAFEVKGGKLTLKNGNVTAHESPVRALGGEVVIESGKYVQTGTAVESTPATYRYSIDAREGGKITINGGEFESGNGMLNVNSGSELVINGGKFTNKVEKYMTRHLAYVSGKLTINGGEFHGVAYSAAGGCFFCGAASSCDIQITGGKFTSLWTSGSVNRIFESYSAGSAITVTGGMFNTNGGIATFVTENTDEATKASYPYVAK